MTTKPAPLIVHVIYEFGTGGLENGLVNIINRSPPGRYRHAVVCLTRSGGFARRITAPGVEIHELHKRPGNDLGMLWRAWRLLWRLRPAVVHTRNIAALEMQLATLFLPGVRRVHGEHGRDVYDLDGSNRRYRLLRKVLCPFMDRFIAVSRDLQDWLVKDVGLSTGRVCQIYNGVDQQRFFPRGEARRDVLPEGLLPAGGRLIGTVGRLAEVKDQATLVRAFAALIARRPDLRDTTRLVLVGDGPMADRLRAAAAEQGIDDLVWMAGDRDDVPELLRVMDLFVLPSLAEGISNTILEAMASGLPVIATRTGGNPELIEDGVNGSLVPVGDATAMAAAFEALLDQPGRLRGMGDAGRRIVAERFNWDRTVEQYLTVYDDILQ